MIVYGIYVYEKEEKEYEMGEGKGKSDRFGGFGMFVKILELEFLGDRLKRRWRLENGDYKIIIMEGL